MIATTVDQYYGHIPGALMYGLAGYVGFSRLVKDKHWLSDIIAARRWVNIVAERYRIAPETQHSREDSE